ncbi:hypothetical protein [Fulvivirga lutea]|uniref:Uncharacterized protein n=1 Tax=Fulvivirga lutea TaxID=2810512 RepID=A0A974WLH9_9BACT|nr:hypothetical protein [Fulvivirga lutea]QSE97593.1 hypothetical protein JR347_00450 [Fulvivirga lutea]
MKNLIYILMIVAASQLLSSCVDDYQDIQEPPLLDAPAIFSFTVSDETVPTGGSTTITLSVVDAPAGLAEVTLTDVDQFGVGVGGSFSVTSAFAGITEGDVVVEYTAPSDFSQGIITLIVTVTDSQIRNGEDVSKSASIETDVLITCAPLDNNYAVNTVIGFDDFDSGPYNFSELLLAVDCGDNYFVEDISGGLWSNDYNEEYGTSARNALITVDEDTNVVTWTNMDGMPVSDQFGGTIIQDPDQPDSNYDPATGVITIYWFATEFGENGVTTYTPTSVN